MSTATDKSLSEQTAELLRLMAAGMQRAAAGAPTVARCVAPDIATLFDLTQRVLCAASEKLVYRVLAEGIKELTDCRTVVVARRSGRDCRVEAVTQVDAFDPHAESILRFQSQCRAALQDDVASDNNVTALKFYDQDEQPALVCLILDEDSSAEHSRRDWLPTVSESVGPAVITKLAALHKSRLRRTIQRVAGAWYIDRRTAWIAAASLLCLSLLPWPYRVLCDCVVEPVVRRHVAAPFDGVFSESLCKPGDHVAVGQVLGRLDAKELQWELAAVVADRDRAAKSRDMNQSAGKTAAAQIDRLEAQRLDERRKLLEHRLAHLEIKSPIAGVVVTGDLERAQGAPVKTGQSLYEVAPLDKMVLEIFVPEREIARVHVDQPLSVTLDSQWLATIDGRLERIYPRAEIRDDANVFVAESTIDNAHGKLRPGLKGRAAVRTDRRPLIWIACHRLVEILYRWLS